MENLTNNNLGLSNETIIETSIDSDNEVDNGSNE